MEQALTQTECVSSRISSDKWEINLQQPAKKDPDRASRPVSDNVIYWGRASSCLSDPLFGKILPHHEQWIGSGCVLFMLLQGIRVCFQSALSLQDPQLVFTYLHPCPVSRFLSLILLTFLVPGTKETLSRPSRAGSWHQHGDFKTP